MSAKTFVVLARRMWAVREAMGQRDHRGDYRRWKALQRRHDRLQDLVLDFAREGVEP